MKSFEISYYHGVEGGESWYEGKRYADIYIPIKKAGKYLLYINQYGFNNRDKIRVEVISGVLRSKYFMILAFLSFLGLLAYPVAYLKHKGVLWSDEDD